MKKLIVVLIMLFVVSVVHVEQRWNVFLIINNEKVAKITCGSFYMAEMYSAMFHATRCFSGGVSRGRCLDNCSTLIQVEPVLVFAESSAWASDVSLEQFIQVSKERDEYQKLAWECAEKKKNNIAIKHTFDDAKHTVVMIVNEKYKIIEHYSFYTFQQCISGCDRIVVITPEINKEKTPEVYAPPEIKKIYSITFEVGLKHFEYKIEFPAEVPGAWIIDVPKKVLVFPAGYWSRQAIIKRLMPYYYKGYKTFWEGVAE